MTAIADLYSRIATEIDRTDSTTAIQNAVTSAIKAHKFTRLAFNEASDTLTTADGTVEYSTAEGLPDDILELDTARITVNSNRYLLEPVPHSMIELLDVSPTHKSRPTKYAWFGEYLRLYPVPDAAYTVVLRYLADVTEETWATRAEALIRCRAKRELYTHLLWDYEAARAMAQAEGVELRSLVREARLKQASGRLVPAPM
jgi:hypothetical protein